jgi:hypothetical protein
METMFGEPIYTYTAAQAVDDGMLVKLPDDLAGPHPIYLTAPHPIYLTAAVVALCTPPKGSAESLNGRVWDVLTTTRVAFSAGDYEDLTLWAVIEGAGLTVMTPEDY